MRHAAAAIVTDDGKLLEAEVLHHLDLIQRHVALRIVGMVRSVRHLAAVAVATKVWRNDGVLLRELRTDEAPCDVRHRRTVQQQEGRTLSALDDVNRGA